MKNAKFRDGIANWKNDIYLSTLPNLSQNNFQKTVDAFRYQGAFYLLLSSVEKVQEIAVNKDSNFDKDILIELIRNTVRETKASSKPLTISDVEKILQSLNIDLSETKPFTQEEVKEINIWVKQSIVLGNRDLPNVVALLLQTQFSKPLLKILIMDVVLKKNVVSAKILSQQTDKKLLREAISEFLVKSPTSSSKNLTPSKISKNIEILSRRELPLLQELFGI